LYILNLRAQIAFKTQDIETSKALYQQVVNVPSEQRLVVIQKIDALIGLAKININTQQIDAAHNVLNKALKLSSLINTFNKNGLICIFSVFK